jgi:2-dehydropantoate 2-reductase
VIAILGSGAVGALLAAELTRAGVETVLVTTERSAEAIARDGITVVSPAFGEHTERVPAVTALEAPPGTLVVAVKAPHLAGALERVAGEPDVVVPLLNGVDHLAVLRQRFPDVSAGTVRVQAGRDGLTRVVHRAPFLTVTLAQPGAPALATGLRAAGIEVVEGAVRATAEAVAREVAAVANAEGAAIDADTVVAELRGLPDAASSSLRADVTAGAADHELDAIGGAVLRAAARHDLAVPETSSLVARLANL